MQSDTVYGENIKQHIKTMEQSMSDENYSGVFLHWKYVAMRTMSLKRVY